MLIFDLNLNSGLASNLFICIERAADLKVRYRIQVYNSLKEFTNDRVGFENLTLHNFKLIFLFYFMILSSILVVFYLKANLNFFLQFFNLFFKWNHF